MDISLEMKALPIELRNMRIKKQDLQKEIRQLEGKNSLILKEIGESNKSISASRKRLVGLTDECRKLTESRKDILRDIAAKTKKLDSYSGRMTLQACDLDERSKRVRKEESKNQEEDLRLKKLKEDLRLQKQDLVNSKESHKKNVVLNVKEGQELKALKEDYKEKTEALENKSFELDRRLNKIKGFRKEFEEGVLKHKQLSTQLENSIKANNELKKKLEDDRQELGNLKIVQKETNDLLEGKVKELGKQIEGQQSKVKEIEVMKLRVLKLAKDKGVDKELKALESSLK